MEVSAYQPGMPSWCDVSSPDLPSTVAFYTGLFGWEAQDQGPEAGGYTMFTLRGKNVAGAGPRMDPSQPIAWSIYVTVADADATMAKVAAAGGTPLMPPMDVLDAGRMAIFADNAGAVLSIWQPGAHIGAQLVAETGTLCWSELAIRDVEAAKAFYGSVFGWTGVTNPMEDTTYTEWHVAGVEPPVGGMMQMNAQWPAEIPPHWMPYFAVDDCDAAARRIAELGGTVSVPPTDIEPGRFAVCGDPHGAYFSIIHLKAM